MHNPTSVSPVIPKNDRHAHKHTQAHTHIHTNTAIAQPHRRPTYDTGLIQEEDIHMHTCTHTQTHTADNIHTNTQPMYDPTGVRPMIPD